MATSLRRFGVVVALLLAAATAHAQTYTHQVFVDRDQDPATGCDVATAAGTIAGAELRLTATIDSYPAGVASLALARCEGAAFGSDAGLAGAYPVGYDLGPGGTDVIEFAASVQALDGEANTPDWTLWFLSTAMDSGAQDLAGPLTAAGLGSPLAPPPVAQPVMIPVLGPWGLLFLSLALGVAVAWAARRHRGLLPVLLVGAALSLSGIAWAANYLLDGQIGDWDVAPLATDPAGDTTQPDPGADLRQVFAAREGARIFFRADVAEAQIERLIAGLLSTSFDVDENAANATVVGELRNATTGLAGLLQFQLLSQLPAGAFAVDANGRLSVADGSQLDAETSASHALEVEASINGVAALTITVDVAVAVNDVNEAPLLADQAFAIDESSAAGTVVGSVAASDPDGDELAYALDAGNTGAAFALDPASGALSVLTPAAIVPSNSPFLLDISASDGVLSTSAVVTVTVNDLNFPPETGAGAAVYGTDEDTVLVETAPGLLAGFTDPDGDPLAVLTTPAIAPANGVLVLATDGGFTYTPDPDFNGDDSFTYTVSDGQGGTADRLVNITVVPVPDAPVGVADSYTVAEGDTLLVPAPGVLGNDTDAEGDALSATLVSGPTHASGFTLNADGSFSYAHDGSEAASDSFSYQASDGGLNSATTVVSIAITPVNDAPVANDDAWTVDEGGTLNVPAAGVLVNDTDAEGDTLNAVLVAGPAHASAFTLHADGSFDYTHDGSEAPLADSFSYQAGDGSDLSAPATVTLAITPVDDAPAAMDDAATVAEDAAATAIDVLANDTDADGGTMLIEAVTQSANATVAITGGGSGLSYQPDPDYCNDGSPTDTFTYTLNGGASATVAVTVTCVDDDPVAVDDAVTVLEDSGANALPVLANDTDIDGGPISIASTTDPANGSVAITGGGSGLDYAPDAEFCGTDAFTYSLAPGGSTATVAVTVSCVDDAPVAVADTATVDEDSGTTTIAVLANDTDLDGGPIAVGAITQASHGLVAVTNGGADLSYTPDADYCNTPPGSSLDSFTYTLAPGGSSTTVTVTVNCLNDAPVVDLDADDSGGTTGTGFAATFTEGSPGVLVVDPVDATVTDVDNTSLDLLSVRITNLLDGGDELLSAEVGGTAISASYDSATGTLSLAGPDTLASFQAVLRTVAYHNDSNAPDETPRLVEFVANDGSDDSAAAVAIVEVVSVDTDPTAVPDSATVVEDAGATAIDVLANDTDPDGGPMDITSVTQPEGGSVAITGGGSGLSYTPDADYCNSDGGTPDSFSYTLSPGGSSAQVTVIVTCEDDAPVAVADSATLTEDDPATTINVLGNDTDVDEGPISISTTSQPANGTVAITGGGTGLTYQPDADYCNQPGGSPDTFTYTLAPGGSTAGVSVVVTCVEDDPVAVDDVVTVIEDSGANTIDVMANDTDPDGGDNTVASVTPASHGTVLITNGGADLSYTPNADYCGADNFGYTLAPGGSSALVSVTVTCVDDPPVAVADSATVLEDSGATVLDVQFNDSDVDGGSNLVLSVTQPANGLALVTNGGADLSYTPNANYCNSDTGTPDTFSYTLQPGGSSATVSVSVTCVNDAPTVSGSAIAAAHTHIAIAVPDGPSDLYAQFSVADVDGPLPIVIGGLLPTVSANGGEVMVDTVSGAFSYNPPANFSGTDSFAVQFCDSDPTPACSAPQTVTLGVSGPEIWFVDDDAVVTGTRDGTLLQPFQTLAEAASAANQSGDRIFLHSGSYTGGVTLASGVSLYGQAAGSAAADDDEFHEVLGITPVLHGAALPAVNQAAPTITAAANSTALALGSGNTIDGVHVETAAATATGIAGASVGALTVDEVSVAGSGPALNLASGTLAGAFTSVASSGGVNNVRLQGLAGSINLGTGALSGAIAESLAVLGGTLSLQYAGDIATANPGGRALLVSDHSAGTIGLSGSIQTTATANGPEFANADGSYQLSGVLTLQGAQGIIIALGSSGTINISNPASAITNPLGIALTVVGSSAKLDYAGSITKANNSTTALHVENNTGGSINLPGATMTLSTGTANAVSLVNNTGATIAITGGNLDIDTSTGIGFNATGGGTVVVQGGNNSINSVSGIALRVTDTSIGTNGLTFRRIDAGNATAAPDPANGIVLSNTGTLAGLTVTGSGVPGSGGTIQHAIGADGTTAGIGVYLNNTRSVSLASMQLGNHRNFAIRGNAVDGFVLADSTINGINGTSAAHDEASIRFTNLTGVSSITNSTVSGGHEDNLAVINTAGVLDRITLMGNTFGANSTLEGNDAVLFQADGTAVIKATVMGNTFTAARGDQFQFSVRSSGANDLVFRDNALSNSHPNIVSGGGCIAVTSSTPSPVLSFDISNNIIEDCLGSALVVGNDGTMAGNFTGTISGNLIGDPGAPVTGSSQGSGIVVGMVGVNGAGNASTTHVVINRNEIYDFQNYGILTQTEHGGSLVATVQGNVIGQPIGAGAFPTSGIRMGYGTNSTGGGWKGCLTIGHPSDASLKNSIANTGTNGGPDIRVWPRFAAVVGMLGGYTGTPMDATGWLMGNNVAVTAQGTVGGTATFQNTCP